jgi:hypothetical protein
MLAARLRELGCHGRGRLRGFSLLVQENWLRLCSQDQVTEM